MHYIVRDAGLVSYFPVTLPLLPCPRIPTLYSKSQAAFQIFILPQGRRFLGGEEAGIYYEDSTYF